MVGSYTDNYGDVQVGRAQIDSIELHYCGQGGYFSPRDPRYSLAFKDLSNDEASSYVRHSSIHHGYNIAIGVHSTNHIELSSNVIYHTTDSSVKLGGSSNVLTIGGKNRRAWRPWPLLNFKTLNRNSNFAIENHLSLVKWPP